jgi:MHS family proline/betaine transporter-like MFS transporter
VSLLSGHWSDRIGRVGIMLAMAALFLLTAYPTFLMMVTWPSLLTAVLAAAWLSLVKAGYSGVLPSLLAELFPTETRGIGMSLSYSISVTIFGGFAPLIATWLIHRTGDPLSPSFYLMFTAILSIVALSATPRFAIRHR